MNTRIALRTLLARQWMIFSLALFAGFVAISVFLLYVLEDTFIDRRLRDVAASISNLHAAPTLPAQFSLHEFDNAPSELKEKMHAVRDGGVREFRLNDGRYLHALRASTSNQQNFILSYDVSNQLYVNAALKEALPAVIALIAALIGLAYLLARRFSNQISRKTQILIAQLGQEKPDAQNLRRWVETETVVEFSELAGFYASALEQQLAALERERDTLRFLAHELRTPLQSAKNSVTLLDADKNHPQAWPRLQRALDRLTRATHSVLWLDASSAPHQQTQCEASAVLQKLIQEMQPLANTKQQTIHSNTQIVQWPFPEEVAETILANLLLNAIQHGSAGEIVIELSEDALRISNPWNNSETQNKGFGLGVVLVQRLLQRFGWELSHEIGDGVVYVVKRKSEAAC